MKALITGASSGIGRDMARELDARGVDLIVVARRGEELAKLKKELHVHVDVICLDLSIVENCHLLYERVRHEDISILINNAGFGSFGEFADSDLHTEMKMIDTNIKAVHILCKYFINHPSIRYIMNVASSAAFLPGPLMASYYATKAYVFRLSLAIHEELRKKKSPIRISVLCPGPVQTEFNKVAHVEFAWKGWKSRDVAHYALRKMFEKKLIIIPGALMKCSYLAAKIMPQRILMSASYHIQRRKTSDM